MLSQRSPIWAYFSRNVAERKAYCNLCSRGISNNGTSAMIRHLTLHPVEFANFMSMKKTQWEQKQQMQLQSGVYQNC